MEIGNIIFGNSRGSFPVQRGSGREAIYGLLSLVSGNDGGGYFDPFENDVFAVSPYYWGDCTCGFYDDLEAWEATHPNASEEEYDRWCKENGHADDCKLCIPNFVYKPTGFELDWYKYPMRDSYNMNQNITLADFIKMLAHCIESVEV